MVADNDHAEPRGALRLFIFAHRVLFPLFTVPLAAAALYFMLVEPDDWSATPVLLTVIVVVVLVMLAGYGFRLAGRLRLVEPSALGETRLFLGLLAAVPLARLATVLLRVAAGHPGSFLDPQPWIECVAAAAWPGCWFLYFLRSRQVRALWKE